MGGEGHCSCGWRGLVTPQRVSETRWGSLRAMSREERAENHPTSLRDSLGVVEGVDHGWRGKESPQRVRLTRWGVVAAVVAGGEGW